MAWILVMYFVGSETMFVHSIPFKSEKTCLIAKEKMNKSFGYAKTVECFKR